MHNKLIKGGSGVSGGWGVLYLGCSRKTFGFVDCSLKQKKNGNSPELGANSLS